MQQAHTLGDFLHPNGEHTLYFTRKLSWYVQVTPFIPLLLDERTQTRRPSELKMLRFTTALHVDMAFAVLNSSLFYWWLTTRSDCRNLNYREIVNLPLDLATMDLEKQETLSKLAGELAQDLLAHAEMRDMRYPQGNLTIQCFYPGKSRGILDQIDDALARHYGLSQVELDFLQNYDGMYRGRKD
jgi:hypothetical protein